MRDILAIKVQQWLDEWEQVDFSDGFRRKPLGYFYIFSMPAGVLRRLAGIQRRTRKDPKAKDLGIQRRHDADRSAEISRYLRGGYPWSTLRIVDAEDDQFPGVRMPGWLPTSIVVNLLGDGDERYGLEVHARDKIKVTAAGGGTAKLVLPKGCEEKKWLPKGLPPIEVIDGQHRLWAFGQREAIDKNFELPVVAFQGLDVGWQAYLFWTINVKPKRISQSLAFDLYPLLRTQSWLEAAPGLGPLVYRETRAQELTESLWSHPKSPWYQRINMLGEPGRGPVSQASFIRSLISSYVKRAGGRRVSIGGLFGAEMEGGQLLPWTRVQQAAYLIVMWQCIRDQVTRSKEDWAESLLTHAKEREDLFEGPYTLLATDQGVRAVLQVTNDMSFVLSSKLKLGSWRDDTAGDAPREEDVNIAMRSLKTQLGAVVDFFNSVGRALAPFDWRVSSTPGLDSQTRLRQAAYRGSGGYKELRVQLLKIMVERGSTRIASAANEVADTLGYDLA